MSAFNRPASRTRAATAWFAKLQRREISASERARFQQWIGAAPENGEEFRRREQLWELLGAVAQDEQLAEETRQVLAHPPASRRYRARLGGFALAASVVLAAFGAWWAVQFADVRDVQTAVGERQMIVLPDSSRIAVNTATHLRIDYRFGRRRIHLKQGEALFDVAHDASHPFVVRTERAIITALGTEFSVAQFNGGVKVDVLDGRVRAAMPDQGAHPSIVLAAGQAGHLSPQGQQWTRSQADVNRIRAWQAGRLEFQHETLEAVIAEFNRYSRPRLVLADQQLAPLRVSGVFRIGHTESLVRALVAVYPIRAHWEADRVLLQYAPQPIIPTRDLVQRDEDGSSRPDIDRPRGSATGSQGGA